VTLPAALANSDGYPYGTIVPLIVGVPVVVVDTSVVLAVLLNEPTRGAILGRTRGQRLLVAGSLEWEIGNALVALVRRQLATGADIARIWRSFTKIPLTIGDCDIPAALSLAVESGLYAYDAFVIETARAATVPLLTLDERQRRVAAARGVEILELT